ncbi:MAG: hypothetical protein IFK94_15965, partial [Acidobacteria bacterium]|nr:hypothetical protein [Candidatus Polarisedimenticola svalbardensis]
RGLLRYAVQDLEQARYLLQEALGKLDDGEENWAAHAVIEHELGWLSRDGGDLEHGEMLLRSALNAARQTGRDDLIAQCASGLAGVVIDTGMFQLSLDLHDEAIEAYKQIGQDQYARYVRSNKGVLLMELGDLGTARTSLEEVFKESEQAGDEFIMIPVASNLGNLEFLAGNPQKAEDWYSRLPESASEQQGFAAFNRGRMSL